MHGGFSFCGVDIELIGLHYAPELEETYVYRPAVINTHVETTEGQNGGYFYGSWLEPKEFILRCYFEQDVIDEGVMARVYALFRRGRTGQLIFDRRPWCYYNATVTEIDTRNILNYANGFIIITMKAMYPFARCDFFLNKRGDPYHETLMNTTGIYDNEAQVLPLVHTNVTSEKTILLGNPGTEHAAVGIKIQGDVGEGVVIANNTTGQNMKIVALTKDATTNENKYLYIDGLNGKTVLKGNGENALAFMYHDYGFIELEAGYPCKRDIFIQYTGNNQVKTTNVLLENYVGMHLFANKSWHKIVNQPDEHTFVLNSSVGKSGTERTTIMTLNEIVIKPVATMDIDSLEFVFKPTFS